jgi:hypothetical protein
MSARAILLGEFDDDDGGGGEYLCPVCWERWSSAWTDEDEDIVRTRRPYGCPSPASVDPLLVAAVRGMAEDEATGGPS